MPEFVQPTAWNLFNPGASLQVSYSVAGPHLHYHHGPVIRDFTGSEIRVVEAPDLGTLDDPSDGRQRLDHFHCAATPRKLARAASFARPRAGRYGGDYDGPPLLCVPASPAWATGVLHGHPASGHSRLMGDAVFVG